MIKVLLAEDQSNIREITGQFLPMLSGGKIVVIEAKNGLEAVRLMNDEVDLVLMDIRMPALDGLAAIEKIAMRWPDVPIWAISAYSNKKPEAISRGAERFYIKPINHQNLVAGILDRVRERPKPIIDSRRAEIEAEIKGHQARLSALKTRRAMYGIESPVSIDLEIDEIDAAIERLQEELSGR